ncbi:hypothetical protein HMPREF0372_00765 [Flavonifractor plautii ATCC 29863]|uniref:Uncharacterized protein n=1 Tax=Flavonifractor plautii ATCC 29863 TaxID=411475 RepID=G9YMP2_FLAPL|nr:hypothetical protein HMPREF0372_00765 [Flavonifractor plautii ATCC 29863]
MLDFVNDHRKHLHCFLPLSYRVCTQKATKIYEVCYNKKYPLIPCVRGGV